MIIKTASILILSQDREKTTVGLEASQVDLYGLESFQVGDRLLVELKLNQRTSKWTVKTVLRELQHVTKITKQAI